MNNTMKLKALLVCAVILLIVLGMTVAPAAAQITWSDDIRLTDDSAESVGSKTTVDSSDNIHIAWQDDRDGNKEIYYTKLDNNGNTLVDDTRLTNDPAISQARSIAVDSSDNIHIAWHDKRDGNYEIYYTKLDNNGNTLVDDTRQTNDPANSWYSTIAADSSNNIHIAWYDKRDGNDEIYYTKLDNNGNTLVDDARLTNDPAISTKPTIAVDSNDNIHIAWYDKRDGNYEIYYTKLDNNGNTLVDDTRLTDASENSYGPVTAVDSSNNIHIAWYDKRDGIYEIYYTKLDNNGNTLVDDTRLTNVPADSKNSWIAVDSNDNIHIAWHDYRDGGAPYCYEIYYTKLDNNGNTLVDDARQTNDPAESQTPTIAVDSTGNIHIAWQDKRDGNYEIYYKKGSVAAAAAGPNITNYAPSSPVSDTVGAARAFNITVNQTVNVSWLINGTEVFNESDVTESTYTNTSAATGTWNVSAIASNANGTDMRQWDWIVTAAAPTPTPTPTPAVFDTGHGTYPSIRGTHTGTFTPNQTMVVNRMYTYPCVGTGGHTESVRFYGPGEVEVTKTWNGYHGDYHGIEFGADAPTLQAGTTYNYTIVTGSYPQIIHNETLTTPDGTINCTEFVDANGKRYTDWIPAIRLESGT